MSMPSNPVLQIVVPPDRTTFSAAGGSRAEAVLKDASDALAQLGDALRDATAGFIRSLDHAAPDEVQLALDLSIEAEGRWFIVAGKAAATVGVTLTWKRGEE